jgi:exodeoxyribonuclease V alpha subunit
MICSFQRLIFPKSEQEATAGSYMVALYKIHGKVLDTEVKRIKEVKVVGYFLPMATDMRFDILGHWSNGKHGMQFVMEEFQEFIQSGRAGIVAYLSSSLIKGIGKVTAEKIYDTFGDQALEVLENRPEELLRISGISPNRLTRIIDSYIASRGARAIVAALAPHGVSVNLAVKILKEYGAMAIKIVKETPYRLCDMHGIGFITADAIARNMGLDPLSADRIGAGLIYTLQDAEGRGHLCLENLAFIDKCVKLLDTEGLTKEMVAEIAFQMLNAGKLIIYNGCTYRDVTAEAEQSVADNVKCMLSRKVLHPGIDLDAAIDEEQGKLGIVLAPEQRNAVKSGLSSSLCIISGGPGTGKTLIQSVLLKIYRQLKPGARVVCCAPTGRAARRMEQCTGYPASTVHKALGLQPDDDGECEEPEPLKADLVLVDEVSMLDIYVARSLLEALPPDCQLILIGDADQLPSVGPGAVLSELIACGRIPVVILDHVFRQDSGSLIATNAWRIRHDDTRMEIGEEFVFYESPTFEQSADLIEKLYLAEAERVGVDNVALLTPFREKTETGVYALNARIREKFNPPASDKPQISFGPRMFRLGDKVMQIKNIKKVSNGDTGYITGIENTENEIITKVDFGDNRIVEYEPRDLLMLELAYACTIHKSQGGEYQSVIINIQMGHYIMLKRPLLNTAITRAKQRVTLVGERKALRIAIHNTDSERRGTMLAHRINSAGHTPAVNY